MKRHWSSAVRDDMNDETIVELADGNTLRSGSKTFMAGDYVRLCDSEGEEIAYWHYDEWQNDPQLVMGAIIRSAAGVSIKSSGS